MPLVLEPFDHAARSRQSVFTGSKPMSQQFGQFCPNLDIPGYREHLSEEKKTELDQRATKLFKRSITNHLHRSSEFCWEACAWHDVFGLILDDEGLRMSVDFQLAFILDWHPRLTSSPPQGQAAI